MDCQGFEGQSVEVAGAAAAGVLSAGSGRAAHRAKGGDGLAEL